MRSVTVILGCLAVATACPAQTPNWTEIKPSTSPSARRVHKMVYDSARQRTVLFGGIDTGGVYLAGIWEGDGKNWTQIKPTNSPSARISFAMAFDSTRQRTVLFGGLATGGRVLLADTWEWDGKNWTQIKPTNSPFPRSRAAVAYDSVRQRTVLFGGQYGIPHTRFTGDTWEWDGKNWTQMKPTTSPSPRALAAMVYDSARRRTVLFGGVAGSRAVADTWEWDGSNWTQMKPTTTPSPRSWTAMVYDSARQRTVLFGGRQGTAGNFDLADTWEWNGTNWAQIKPTKSPLGRCCTGLAYDSVRQRVVLFGGYNGSNFADTWEYGGAKLTLTANTPTISIANGGTQTLTLNAGGDLKNKSYWIFGSATSTMPGVLLTGIHIPLRPDIYTDIAIGFVNSNTFSKFRGTLSATGSATASLKVPANLPVPSGFKLYHAYVVYDGTTGQVFTSSNPVSVEFK